MSTAVSTVWKIDPVHSEIEFKVKHLVISTVKGEFMRFDATAEVDGDDFEGADITFEADVTSVTTRNEQRDQHLLSDDFFAADKYPKLIFKSTEFKKTGDNTYKLTGDLTIRDVTKNIELDVEYGGTVQDAYGNTKAGFEIIGSINRKEFGLKWNGVTEAGNIVVSDLVTLQLSVQFAKQA